MFMTILYKKTASKRDKLHDNSIWWCVYSVYMGQIQIVLWGHEAHKATVTGLLRGSFVHCGDIRGLTDMIYRQIIYLKVWLAIYACSTLLCETEKVCFLDERSFWEAVLPTAIDIRAFAREICSSVNVSYSAGRECIGRMCLICHNR